MSELVPLESTLRAKRQHLDAFLSWFGADRNWTEVRRRDALDFMRHLLDSRSGKDGNGPKLSRTTVVKVLSAVRLP